MQAMLFNLATDAVSMPSTVTSSLSAAGVSTSSPRRCS